MSHNVEPTRRGASAPDAPGRPTQPPLTRKLPHHAERPLDLRPVAAPPLPSAARDAVDGAAITVVGAGPAGKMAALFFATAGSEVVLIDNESLNTGRINAGWGWPYHADDPAAVPLSVDGIHQWQALADFFPAGVVTEETSRVQRGFATEEFPAELARLQGFRRLERRELAPGMVEGVEATSVVIPPKLLHEALDEMLAGLGVSRVSQTIRNEEHFVRLDGQVLINTTGLATAWLFGDEQFRPTLGTVVRLAKPPEFEGVHAWETGTTTSPYAITQRAAGLVVAGGTTIPTTIAAARDFIADGAPADEVMGDFILAQLRAYAPALHGAEVVKIDTGVRPGRTEVLLGPDAERRRVLHATGLGGFGVTAAPAVALRLVVAAAEMLRARRR